MVFTHNDALSGLDITKMQAVQGVDELSIVDDIKKKVEAQKKLRPMNQWKLFLQKNLNNIAMDCLAADFDREYGIEYKDFMKVIDRRAKIPEYLKQQNGDLLHEFIAEYTDADSGKVDYRGLIDELRNFNYEEANNNKNYAQEREAQNASSSKVEPRKRTIYEDDYIVLDSQKVPVNVLDQIENRLAKVGRFLKRSFLNEKALDKALRETLPV